VSKHEFLSATKPNIVRLAKPEDAPQLRALLDRLHDEVPNPADLPPDDEKVWHVVNTACTAQGGIAGVIDGPEGDIVASIGIFWNEPWWTRQGILSQYWMFVDKDYRFGGRYHRALEEFARWHRDDMSARVGRPMALENSFITKGDVRPRMRLWSRFGKCVGMIFLSKD
jgi:hypothetical protein